jgi:uncharacterized protein YbjT (DUF2867 family)
LKFFDTPCVRARGHVHLFPKQIFESTTSSHATHATRTSERAVSGLQQQNNIMPETILVVGATGMLGEPVARRLAEEGHKVRVMSRNLAKAKSMFYGEGFEAVEGDVEDQESLRKAMTGCTGVHLNLAGHDGDCDLERRGAQVASKVASEIEGMKRITIITGATTCEENDWFPGTKAKLEAEKAIKASGVPYTIFRCTMFMESLPKWVQGKTAHIMGEQHTLWHWVAAKDYADMVAMAYCFEEAANKTFYVYGPEKLTMEQALKIYIPACAPNAKISHVSFWSMKLPHKAHLRKDILPWMRYFNKVRELGGEVDIAEANGVLGAPVVTVEAWCEAQRGKQQQ